MADENDPGAGTAAAADNSTDTMFNLARAAKGVALLCFVLPFVTVSCAGTTIGQITGVQLATGNVGQIGQNMPGAPAGGGASAAQDSSLDIFALGAALLIIAGLVVTFVLARRRASLIAMACAALAAVLIAFDVLIRIGGAVADRVRESSAGSTGASDMERQMQQQMEQMVQQISVSPAIGFWLCILALIAAIVLFNMVRTKRTGP
jgi:hypothetical protein